MNLKKYKLNTIFILGLAFLLGMTMLLMATAALSTIKKLGDFAISKIKTAITNQSSELFFDDTIERAVDYSEIFDFAYDLSSLYTSNVGQVYKNLNNFAYDVKDLDDFGRQFRRKSIDDIKDVIFNRNTRVVYCGYHTELPENLKKFLYFVSTFDPMMNEMLVNNDYNVSAWLCLYKDYVIYRFTTPEETLVDDVVLKSRTASEIRQKIDKLYIADSQVGNRIIHFYQSPDGDLLLSCGRKFYNEKGELIFSAGIDISMKLIVKDLFDYKLPMIRGATAENDQDVDSFCFVIDKKQESILAISSKHTAAFGVRNTQSAFGIFSDHKIEKPDNPEIIKLIKYCVENNSGITYLTLNGEKFMVAFSKTSLSDYIYCSVVSIDDILHPVVNTEKMMNNTITGFKIGFILLAGFFLTFTIVLVVIFFKLNLITPIIKFRNKAVTMADGNFGVSVFGRGTAEIKDLSRTFNYLGGELRKYMKGIESELVKKSKITNEMKAAREIQQAILPRVTSIFRERGIDLFAKLVPAKEVAGDFYDFFYLSKNRIVILIADVSGKGISASFFMSISKRVLRNTCSEFPNDPSEAMKKANDILASYNIKMFVTVFLIYYDIQSGEIHYANAGHNESIIIDAGGRHRLFGNLGNMVAGFFPDVPYKQGREQLVPGDILLLYTDGVVEAKSPDDKLFGEERLLSYLEKSWTLNIRDITEGLFRTVHEFEVNDQFDDITVLVLKR